MDRLSMEDAAILALESPTIAGHSTKLMVIDPPQDGGPKITAAALRAHVSCRLHLVPRARQRLAPTPLGVALPVWVDDESFAIERHITRVPTTGTVTRRRLELIVADIIGGRLDREHPL